MANERERVTGNDPGLMPVLLQFGCRSDCCDYFMWLITHRAIQLFPVVVGSPANLFGLSYIFQFRRICCEQQRHFEKDAVCLEAGLARWCWAVANDIGPRNFSRDCDRNIHSASAPSSLAGRAQGH